MDKRYIELPSGETIRNYRPVTLMGYMIPSAIVSQADLDDIHKRAVEILKRDHDDQIGQNYKIMLPSAG